MTQFFVGGKLPNEPGVRVIPFDSDEDKEFVRLFLGLVEKAIGLERAAQLDQTPWEELRKGKPSAHVRMLKNLYGSILFFQNHRQAME